MKGESKFFTKAIYLIIVLLVISLIINRIVSLNLMSSEEKEGLKFAERASDILEILISSDKCLSYKESGKVENNHIKLASHKILDKNKLDEFQIKYSDIEPDCSIDFDYSYRVKVITFPVNIFTIASGGAKETINVKINSQKWEFGTMIFSEGEAFEKNMTISIPVVVYYDLSKILPGVMSINLVSGEMERMIGFIEDACLTEGSSSIKLFLHYPTYIEILDKKSYLCMNFNSGKKCQKLNCEKIIDFEAVQSPGSYNFISFSDKNKLKITK